MPKPSSGEGRPHSVDHLEMSQRRWYRIPRLRVREALPMNADIEVARTVVGVPVVIRIRLVFIGLAALGGAVGAATRFQLTRVTPTWETLSVGTLIVNILGPFFLGVLLQALAAGAETRRRRALRLLVGVGFLGALTSYAQLAVDTVIVSENSHVLLAIGYAASTIIAGAGAAWLGIVTTKWIQRRKLANEASSS